jgi:hypothetical protein
MRTWLSVAILISVLPLAAADADTPLTIGMRRSTAGKVWLQKSLADDAFQAEAADVARLLADDKIDALDKRLLTEAVERDRSRSVKAFSACLNYQKYAQAAVRLGALRGLEIATASQQDARNAALRTAGKAVAGTMLAEPVPQIRAAAMKLVRDHKDDTVSTMASASLVEFWRAAFDSDGLVNEAQRDAALGALKDLGDKRTYHAILYYATIEIHAGSAAPVGVDTASIQGRNPIVNLPIDLPINQLMSFDGTIVVPAVSALKHITGQEFAKNLDKWRAWINQQPDFRK